MSPLPSPKGYAWHSTGSSPIYQDLATDSAPQRIPDQITTKERPLPVNQDQIRTAWQSILTEKQRSQSRCIAELTEKFGYVEAKQKILEDDQHGFPRESQRVQTDVETTLLDIQNELAELAVEEDLAKLEEANAQIQEEEMVKMKSALDELALEITELKLATTEEIWKITEDDIQKHNEARAEIDPRSLEGIRQEVGNMGEDMLHHFSEEHNDMLDNISIKLETQFDKQAQALQSRMDQQKYDSLNEVDEHLAEAQVSIENDLGDQQLLIEQLSSQIEESARKSTDYDEIEARFQKMQDTLSTMTSQAKDDHAGQVTTLEGIRAQHESSMVALTDLNTKLDIFADQKAESQHDTIENEQELQDRIDLVQARLEKLETYTQSNLQGAEEIQKKVQQKEKIVAYMEGRMENVIDRINGIEQVWTQSATPIEIEIQIDLALKDEKEATFGKNKGLTEPSPELMSISLNDYGESDTESAVDFLSPKESPLNRIPGAPTSSASVFQFNASTVPPEQIKEEVESEAAESETEDLESEEEFDIKDVTKGLFERVLQEELMFCLNFNQTSEAQSKQKSKPPSFFSDSRPPSAIHSKPASFLSDSRPPSAISDEQANNRSKVPSFVSDDWNTDLSHSDISRNRSRNISGLTPDENLALPDLDLASIEGLGPQTISSERKPELMAKAPQLNLDLGIDKSDEERTSPVPRISDLSRGSNRSSFGFSGNVFHMLVVGKKGSGKSSFMIRFSKDDKAPARVKPTKNKNIKARQFKLKSGGNVKIRLYEVPDKDMAAQAKASNAYFYIIDLTDPDSMDDVQDIKDKYQGDFDPESLCITIGTKCDSDDRRISPGEFYGYVTENSDIGFEVSAQTGEGYPQLLAYMEEHIETYITI